MTRRWLGIAGLLILHGCEKQPEETMPVPATPVAVEDGINRSVADIEAANAAAAKPLPPSPPAPAADEPLR